MPTGLERRDVAQDPNAQRQPQQPDSVPLSPVMTPRPAGLSQVGESERAIAGVLGEAQVGFQKYINRKAEEWKLEGQMAYAEGKTEEEIVKSGNRYTTAGFMSMKARTAGNEFLTQAMADIDNEDHKLDSAQYQAKLKKTYSEMVAGVAGGDAYTRQLMASMAENTFPQLVSQQIKSNNAWREEETYSSYKTMMMSEAQKYDPANPESVKNLKELATHNPGLPDKLHRKALTEAITENLNLDNDSLFNLLGFDQQEKIQALDGTAGIPNGLLQAVLNQESNNRDFNAKGEVLTSSKGAKGRMQVLDGTNTDPGFGVTPAQDNSLEERARVGRDYLSTMIARYDGDITKGLMAYNWGPGSVDSWIENGSDPKQVPDETKDYVLKIAGMVKDPQALKATISRGSTVQAMIDAGFEASEIVQISNEYDKFSTRKSNEFNKARILAEESILDDALTQGNFPQALNSIEAMKNQYGYNDDWANSMASRAETAVDAYEKEYGKTVELQSAIANDQVATLSSEKQEKANDQEKARIVGIVNSQATLDDEERGKLIRDQYSDYLVRNNVVDKKWASSLQATLTGNVLSKDGSVKPEAIAAFDDYKYLSQKASPAYAAKYLGDAEDLITTAESYDGGGSLQSDEALMIASEVLSRKRNDPNYTPPPIDTGLIAAEARKYADTFDSWFPVSMKPYRTLNQDVRDYEIAQVKSDPRVVAHIQDVAVRAKLRNPNIPDKAAVAQGRNDLMRRGDYVMGNLVTGSKTSTIREDMKFNFSEPTALDKVGQEYLKEFGPDLWGKTYNDFQFFGSDPLEDKTLNKVGTAIKQAPTAIMESIRDKRRGVPAALWTYDKDRKAFIVDLYKNKERTMLMNAPIVIPAAELGQFGNNLFSPTQKVKWKG